PEDAAKRQVEHARGKQAEADAKWERDSKNKGIIANSQANIRAAVAELGAALAYDSFAERLLIAGPEGQPQRTLGDAEVDALYLEIDEQFRFRPSEEFLRTVVENEARASSFHPVRDYLDGLKWDGKRRIDTWLVDYGGAEDTDYV